MRFMSERIVPVDSEDKWIRISDNKDTLQISMNHPSLTRLISINYTESEMKEIRDAITAVLKNRKRRLKRAEKEAVTP